MKQSTNRILTTHVGSLPRPAALIPLMMKIGAGETYDPAERDALVKAAVNEAVRLQVDHGIDVINDGEMGRPSFVNYVNDRLGGFEPAPKEAKSKWTGTREVRAFPEFYQAEVQAVDSRLHMQCVAPITYAGHDVLRKELDLLKSAAAGRQHEELFMPAASPYLLAIFQKNQFYKTFEEYLFAIAAAMHEEYKLIVDSGCLVQVDDPTLLSYYMRNPDITLSQWRQCAEMQVEALNLALKGIPTEKIRHHICYGINMGPRVHDLEFKEYIDVLLTINAGGYSFEAANPRHEHEWRVWETAKLPEGKVILPGVITQSTFVVEHPMLVADRIERFANIVGRENVIASTDCGFSSSANSLEMHPSVVWAKFDALREGARIASERLWSPRKAA